MNKLLDTPYLNLDISFIGCLKNYDIELINSNTIDTLLSKELIVEGSNQSNIPYSFSEKLEFPLYFNNVEYMPSGKLLFEIGNLLKIHVEEVMSDYWSDIELKMFKLESFLSLEKKIEYLESLYQETFPVEQFWDIYKGRQWKGFENWDEWIYHYLTFCPDLIKMYLKIDTSTYLVKTTPDEYCVQNLDFSNYFYSKILEFKNDIESDCLFVLLEDWKVLYEKDKQLTVILEKIKDLKTLKDTSSNVNVEEDKSQLKPSDVPVESNSYSIENVVNEINRYPFVFKDARSCELYIYISSFWLSPKRITYSYYYEIFEEKQHFIKNIDKIDYQNFLNKQFGLPIDRHRNEVSDGKSNKYYDNYEIVKKQFDRLIFLKSTI